MNRGLKELREAKGMSHEELADAVNERLANPVCRFLRT